jgi:hypothetical protein
MATLVVSSDAVVFCSITTVGDSVLATVEAVMLPGSFKHVNELDGGEHTASHVDFVNVPSTMING